MTGLPEKIRVVEVGPRDGLQGETQLIDSATKIELINRLSSARLPVIEATSFVSPRWIPQLSDAEAVLAGIDRRPGTDYQVLVPNLRVLQRAL